MNRQQAVQSKRKKSPKSATIGLFFWLLVVAITLVNRQNILDWFKLYGYTAPSTVSALATDSTMTPYATKVFYVNHPSIDQKLAFSQNCNSRTEQTIVLGCYHGNQNGIYLLSVSDARLHGVEEVTAAHEMLHAAYNRLSTKERHRVDALLNDYYANNLKDQRIRDEVDSYKTSEPNDITNEMHSIFGTEVGTLPPELETYYQQYFKDRSKVVAYSTAYASEFTSRRQQVSNYDTQLTGLKKQIETATNELTAQEGELQASRARLQAERDNGDVQSYNSQVPVYNAAVEAYNAKITVTKQLIAEYNVLVEKRNAIALEVSELAHAISGDALPQSR